MSAELQDLPLVAAALPEAEVLVQKLLGFEVRITSAGNDPYGAWRACGHDDLVLAVALACWVAHFNRGSG